MTKRLNLIIKEISKN
nr:unnamed protein product [Callosobruchus analis]